MIEYEFRQTVLVCMPEPEDVRQIALSGALALFSRRARLIFAVPHKCEGDIRAVIERSHVNCLVVSIPSSVPLLSEDVWRMLLDRHQPLFAVVSLSSNNVAARAVVEACLKWQVTSVVIQTGAPVFTGKRRFQSTPSFVVVQGKDQITAAKQATRTARGNIFDLGPSTDPGFAAAFDALASRSIEPLALKMRRKLAEVRYSISHHQGADRVLANYADVDFSRITVHGYWIHGWHPPYHAQHPLLVALHKKEGIPPKQMYDLLSQEREDEWQFVTRPDQVDYLKTHGYAKVQAIGLPFAYLPKVEVKRRPNSLLVLPPHGRKRHFEGDSLAEAYAEKILTLRDRFDEIWLGVPESDYLRGEWRHSFEKRGIPVLVGNNPFRTSPLAETQRLFSSFEYVTTNGFGSHIVYAAACGAKVSVCGPVADWERDQIAHTNAYKLNNALSELLLVVNSNDKLKEHFPFLFCEPEDAGMHEAWAREQIGADQILSPEEVRGRFMTAKPRQPRRTAVARKDLLKRSASLLARLSYKVRQLLR